MSVKSRLRFAPMLASYSGAPTSAGNKKFGDWDNAGGIRLGQGVGIEVDDTHIVRVYP
jgi:hypothetical protein